MTIIKTISMDEETAQNLELVKERLGIGASHFIQKSINEKAKQLTQPKRKMNKRMQMEAEEFGE